MSAEFHSNGYIEQLIKKYGPNAKEVKKAIEFWGPDAGEFSIDGNGATNEYQPAASMKVPDKG